jgi:toxin YoeB
MEIILSQKALDHIEYWRKTNNQTIQKRITKLKNAILANPYKGIGKPEPLKHQLSGMWSRRIDKENRFVYKIQNHQLHIFSLRGHYG